MGSTTENNKRIAKNTLLLYVRMLFSMTVGLYTSRVILNALGVEDFGIYNVVGGVVTMFDFIKGSLSGATQRYITIELGKRNIPQLKKIFSISLSIHILFSLIIIILAETIGLWFLLDKMHIPDDRMTAALWVYQCSILTSVIIMISAPYNAAIIAHERMNVFAYMSILEVVLKLLIVFLLPCFPLDRLIFYAILIVTSQILIRFFYKSYCNKHFKETIYHWQWDKSLFKEVLAYTGWTLNGNLAVVGYTQGLNILLNLFFTPIVNAARGIAVQVEGVVRSFCLNFQMALNPQLTKSYAQNNHIYMHRLIVISSKLSFYMILFLSLPIMFKITPVLKWWLDTVPEYTSTFVRIILMSSMLSVIANPVITSIHATGNIRHFQIIEGTMLLSIIPLSYLVLKFTPAPPASVFIVHFIVELCTQYVRIRIVLPQVNMKIDKYVKEVIVPIATVGLLSPILPYIIYCLFPEDTLISFFLVSTTCVLSTGLSAYFIGCTTREKEIIKAQIIKIQKKITK